MCIRQQRRSDTVHSFEPKSSEKVLFGYSWRWRHWEIEHKTSKHHLAISVGDLSEKDVSILSPLTDI